MFHRKCRYFQNIVIFNTYVFSLIHRLWSYLCWMYTGVDGDVFWFMFQECAKNSWVNQLWLINQLLISTDLPIKSLLYRQLLHNEHSKRCVCMKFISFTFSLCWKMIGQKKIGANANEEVGHLTCPRVKKALFRTRALYWSVLFRVFWKVCLVTSMTNTCRFLAVLHCSTSQKDARKTVLHICRKGGWGKMELKYRIYNKSSEKVCRTTVWTPRILAEVWISLKMSYTSVQVKKNCCCS